MIETPLRIGVIGAGVNSQRNHLPTLKRLAGEGAVSLSMLCDLNADLAAAAASEFGFARHTHDVEGLLKSDDIDAVYVIGTVQMHAEYLQKALESGKHVFVEKPPAESYAQLRALCDLADRMRRVACVGLNRRFYSSIEAVHADLAKKTRIYSVEGVYNKPFLNETYLHGSSSWISYSGIHGIDAVVAAVGRPPSEVFSAANRASGEFPQNFSLLLKWDDGVHAVVSSNNSAGSRAEKYTIHAPGISYTCTESAMEVHGVSGNVQTAYKDPLISRGFYGEHREFIDAIATGKAPRHSVREALVIMRIVECIEKGIHGKIDVDQTASVEEVKAGSVLPQRAMQAAKKSGFVLVLNPTLYATVLPDIAAERRIVSASEFPGLSEEEKREIVAVLTGGGVALSDEMLEELPQLAVVGIAGASVRKYNAHAILTRRIPILNASEVYARSVAEFALMQALVGLKRASRSHDLMRSGGWGHDASIRKGRFGAFARIAAGKLPGFLSKPLRSVKRAVAGASSFRRTKRSRASGGEMLRGARIGLIGWGAITREFIKLLKPFGCTILVYSDHLSAEEAENLGVSKVLLAEALNADIVSLHRGLTENTRASFGATEIAMLRPGAILLNTSRGEIVDEHALVDRLKRGDIFACLDVFAEEPLSSRSPLRALPNVFLTSHMAGVTRQTFENAPREVALRALAHLEGSADLQAITSIDRLSSMT